MVAKKKWYLGVIMIIVVVIAIYGYPMSLDDLIWENNRLEIAVVGSFEQNGYAQHSTSDYSLNIDSEKYDLIRKAVSKYKYHRVLLNLTHLVLPQDTHENVTVIISSGKNSIMIYSTGDILVNDKYFRLDYLGYKQSRELIDDILDVLDFFSN